MNKFFTKKTVRILLIVLFALIFVASALSIISYFVDSNRSKDNYDDLAGQLITAPTYTEDTDPEGQPVVPSLPPEEDPYEFVEVTLEDGSKKNVLRKYSQVYPQNTDMVGWMTIPGTDVNYPVMHTPGDPEYYLHRNFKKEDAKAGSLFVHHSCDVFAPSDNVTIYGHNMKDGSMFRILEKYKEKSFWEEHKTITFDTINEHHTYEIVAVFKTTATVGKGFDYHNFDFAESEQDFKNFVQKCHNRELYETGVTAEYGDKLITLSTCEYSQANGRLVVVAKRVG